MTKKGLGEEKERGKRLLGILSPESNFVYIEVGPNSVGTGHKRFSRRWGKGGGMNVGNRARVRIVA